MLIVEAKYALTLLMGIPESVGLMAFGVAMAGTAIVLRNFLSRREAEKKDGDNADQA